MQRIDPNLKGTRTPPFVIWAEHGYPGEHCLLTMADLSKLEWLLQTVDKQII